MQSVIFTVFLDFCDKSVHLLPKLRVFSFFERNTEVCCRIGFFETIDVHSFPFHTRIIRHIVQNNIYFTLCQSKHHIGNGNKLFNGCIRENVMDDRSCVCTRGDTDVCILIILKRLYIVLLMDNKRIFTPEQLHYLRLLSKQFPTVQAAGAEIIKLKTILNLPKGTEHFMSDIHGEHEAFLHILNSGSGEVKEKLEELFGNAMTQRDRNDLATLIYYPASKLALVGKCVGVGAAGMVLYLLCMGPMVPTKEILQKLRRGRK